MSLREPDEPLQICFQNRQRAVSLDNEQIRGALDAVASCFEGIAPSGAQVAFVLVSERRIKELNRTYAGVNESTDVLSFPIFDDGPVPDDPGEIGDVVVSIQHAIRQTGTKDRRGHPRTRDLMEELILLLVHGILHLVGYDHQDTDGHEEMIARECQIIERYRASFP